MLTWETLDDRIKECFKNNTTIGVAFVAGNDKKGYYVRHIGIRKNFNTYVRSTKEKSEKQANVFQNNNLLGGVDINEYKNIFKQCLKSGMSVQDSKIYANQKAYRTMKLGNALAFTCGKFVDYRDENNILERFGESMYNDLTKTMLNKAIETTPDEEQIIDMIQKSDDEVAAEVAESVIRRLFKNKKSTGSLNEMKKFIRNIISEEFRNFKGR